VKAGWLVKPIGELCDIVGGGTPSKSNAGFFGGGIPWATVRDMKTDWIEATEHSITPAAVKSSATHILPAGTVVIASRVGLGKVCRVANDTAINQDLRGFIPKPRAQLDHQYLFWWFKSVADRIVAAGNGATVQGVTLPFLRSLAIPLPPLDEQRRIVAVLDKAFAGIAAVTASAQKNLTNARGLFESYAQATFAVRGAGWTERRFDQICENLDSIRRPVTKNVRTAGNVPYYGASGQVDSVADYLFDEDLLLVSEDGANLLMRTYPIAFSISGKSWVNNHAHVLRFAERNTRVIVEYYLNSISLEPYVGGMAQPKLNQKSLNGIPIPLPPHNQRARMVVILDELSNHRTKTIPPPEGLRQGIDLIR